MKILLISGIYRPDIGGPATYIPTLAEKLLKNKSYVEIVTLRSSFSKTLNEQWIMNYIKREQNLLIRMIKTTILIKRKVKFFDAIFANGLFEETAFALLFSTRHSVAKVVSDPVWERALNRGKTVLNVADFNKSKLHLKQKIQRILLVWSLERFDYITCPSAQLKQIIESWGVSKQVIFIPNGVPSATRRTSNISFDLVTACRLIPLKNLNKLITAAKETSSTLAIIGSGPEEERLKVLANQINADVTFFGEMKKEEVIEIFFISTIYVNISDHEGLSFALLEAMACGLPSIVSNIPGNTHVITDSKDGIIIDLNDQEQLSSAIMSLKNSQILREEYGQSALNKVNLEYSQSTQLDKVMDLLLKNRGVQI